MADVTIHDRSGLLLSSSPEPSDEDINQAELVGIVEAAEWAEKSRLDPKEVKYWKRLHKQMFGQVWDWAGDWRKHESNIGVPPQDIQPQLKNLHDDLVLWLSDECDISVLELVVRFHHRLVYVHPFPNGNGRWARLMTDVLVANELGGEPLVWAAPGGDLRDLQSAERKKYIAAIKAADKGEIEPLMECLKELNPDIL